MAEMTRQMVKAMSIPDIISLVSDVALLTDNPALEGVGDRIFQMQYALHEARRQYVAYDAIADETMTQMDRALGNFLRLDPPPSVSEPAGTDDLAHKK